MEWHILGILAFVVIYNIYRYYHEDDNNGYSPVDTKTSKIEQAKEKVMDGSLFTWICPNCTVLEMTNGIWEFTERKHVISYDEYLRVCEKIK